jgi:methyltransferase-like protein/16S rRNA G527 N7-methylase RsmG
MTTEQTTYQNSDHAAYDQLPYESNAFAASHPAHIAGVARLFGLSPTDVAKARVLELGSAAGGNIIPIAIYYPESTVVGVDYSKVQIDDGLKVIEQIGLTNASLKHMSIADITPEFGQFDYIICHGVYSWVPPEVQDAILRVCQENLTDNGIAYISYNVYPGWKTHEIARDAMLFHTRNIDDQLQQVAHGRGMIQYMHEMSRENSMFRHVMNAEVGLIQNAAPYYIAHEFFETHNAPCYFNEFIKRASQHHLSYLGESDMATMFVENLGEEHKLRLINASNGQQIELEQYLDFLNNRTFRQTLLCKSSATTQIKRKIEPENFKFLDYHIALLEEKNATDIPEGTIKFIATNQRWLTVSAPLEIETLRTLQSSAPNTLSYDELKKSVEIAVKSSFNEKTLLTLLERLTVMGFLIPYMHTCDEVLTKALSLKPKMKQTIAKYISITQRPTNMLHNMIGKNAIFPIIIESLDGQHTIEELENMIFHWAKEGKLSFNDSQTGVAVTDEATLKKEAKSHLNQVLTELANNGFLIS